MPTGTKRTPDAPLDELTLNAIAATIGRDVFRVVTHISSEYDKRFFQQRLTIKGVVKPDIRGIRLLTPDVIGEIEVVVDESTVLQLTADKKRFASDRVYYRPMPMKLVIEPGAWKGEVTVEPPVPGEYNVYDPR